MATQANPCRIPPAHRYVLQMVVYARLRALLQLAFCFLLMLLGGVAGLALAVAGTLAIASFFEWVLCTFFPMGICG